MEEETKNPGEAIWEYTRGPHNRNVRRRLWRSFRKFPDMKVVCKDLIDPERRAKIIAMPRGRFLEDVHPDAFKIIHDHGKEYNASTFRRPPEPRPKDGECCSNSISLMGALNKSYHERDEPHRLVYVEGIVYGEFADPMLHAWNAFGTVSKVARDWTHYAACQWAKYYGIPFTEEDYRRIHDKMYAPDDRRCVFIFRKEFFPHVRDEVMRILEERKKLQVAA